MKQLVKKVIRTASGCAALFACAVMAQAPSGQWDFNSSNLVATVGADLQYANAATQAGTQFGSTTNFGIPAIDGTNAIVMLFPITTNGMGYMMPTPAVGNGGGSLVNEWALILDVLYPSVSDGSERPILDADGDGQSDFLISAGGGLGHSPNGPFDGSILPNIWYRIGFSVSADTVTTYVNGAQVGSHAGTGLDGTNSLAPLQNDLILGTTGNSAAVGYVNSIQLRAAALNPGQMAALGGPSAAGIPQTIPPVPSFVQTRTPGVNATGIKPTPDIDVVLNQGDTTVNANSIKLLFDGVALPTTVNSTPPTFEVTGSVTNILDPVSSHNITLTWSDNAAGARSAAWSFTVLAYQNVNLPAPFYFENFNELSEITDAQGPLPPGWTVANQTTHDIAGFDLDARDSDSYLDWVLVSSDRFSTWGDNRTAVPPVVLNGQLLTSLADGNLMWAESDQRCGGCAGQFQELYTADIDCTGKTNVYVAWKSIYMQNQDNMNCAEYSIDGGTNWLPVLYMFCTAGNGENSDIYYTNDASGIPIIDVGKTFFTVEPNRNWSPDTSPVHATNYAIYIKAPITTNLIPYIKGYTNDDNLDGKRIEQVRIPKADGQAKVRFRFLDTGTSSWFWGIDDLGLYEINTPTITTQPKDVTVSASETATFTVVASSPTPLTYHWKHAGTNLSDGGHFSGATNATLTISNCETNDAGSYVCVVGNLYGTVNSAGAKLTVVAAPQVFTQPVTVVSSAGFPVSLSVAALGRPPLVYQWLKDGSPVGPSSSTLSFPSVQLSDAGRYQVTVTNSDGSSSSASARIIVPPGGISSNLVVHLKFDGDYTDASGRGNNASAMGSPGFSSGKIGQAFKFTTAKDGSEIDFATLGYPDDLKFGATTDFTISFWANYTLSVDDPAFISNKDWGSSGNVGWGMFTQDNGHFRDNVTGTGGTKYDLGAGSTPLVRDGTWHNIVMSYARAGTGSGVVSTYVDGELVDRRADTTTGTIDTDSQGYAVNIGQDGRGTYTDGGSAGITNALIDDVGIWRRAVSPQEASAIYTTGQGGKDLSLAVVSSPVASPALSFTVSGNTLNLSWSGAPGLKLQQTTKLSPSTWTDVAGTLGANSASVPMTGSAAFFRLSN